MYELGIDLGTTFTAAAIRVGDRVDIAPLGSRSPVIPSVVLLAEDGTTLTGDAANAVRSRNRHVSPVSSSAAWAIRCRSSSAGHRTLQKPSALCCCAASSTPCPHCRARHHTVSP